MITVFKKWMSRIFSNEEAILLLVLMSLTLALIVFLGHVLAPILVALVAAFLLQGAVSSLGSIGVPERFAVLITFLSAMFLVGLSVLFVMPLLVEQTVNLFTEAPKMVDKLRQLALGLNESYPQFITEQAVQSAADFSRERLTQLGQWLITNSLANLIGAASLLVYVVLVPFLVFFMLKDRALILKWFSGFLPEERPLMQELAAEMNQQVANYVRGKAIEILIVGIVSYVTFLFLDLNYAELLAIIVGLSVLVPFIGAAVITIPVLLVGFFQWGFGAELAYLTITYAIIQALDGNVLVPILFSETVNLHPIAIIVAVVFFGGIWGFWGIFFAIPLATLIKAVIKAWPVYKQEILEHS